MIMTTIFNAVIPIPISMGGSSGGTINPIYGVKLWIAIALVCTLILVGRAVWEYIRMKKIKKTCPSYFCYFWRDLINRTCDSFVGQGMLMFLSALLFVGLVFLVFWLIR